MEELQRKLERLENAFVYEQEIDNETYVRMRDKVREELTSAQTLSQHVHAEGVDVEAALASSAKVLSRAKDLWQGATLDHRKRLQHALFPRGLAHNGKSFRTVVTCIAMKDLDSGRRRGLGWRPRGDLYLFTVVGSVV